MAASRAQSSKTEVGLSDVSRVDFDCMGTLDDRNFTSSDGSSQKMRKAVIRKESAETQDYVSCQDMEAEDNNSLEGFIPSAVGEPLRVKHMCDQKRDEKGLKFQELAAILTDERGTPPTINLCRDCFDYRLIEQGESKVSNAVWKDMIRQSTSRGRFWAVFGPGGFIKRMRERFAIKKGWAKHLLEQAAKAVQLETDSSWQNESPHEGELELLRMGSDLRGWKAPFVKRYRQGKGATRRTS